MIKLSELFGKDIYTGKGDYKGKIFDIVVNLETGTLETITTEPLKVKSKNEAKKIITEKSIPYKNVIAVKDIFIVSNKNRVSETKPSHEHKKLDVSSARKSLLRYR